ncbi:unnamed protein product, partial [Polarella glacialis]
VGYDGQSDAERGAQELTKSIEEAIGVLRQSSEREVPAVAEALSGIRWRSEAMMTCYPAESRARYFRHTDNSSGNGRLLTAILYLNEGWETGHGGELRLFQPGGDNLKVTTTTTTAAATTTTIQKQQHKHNNNTTKTTTSATTTTDNNKKQTQQQQQLQQHLHQQQQRYQQQYQRLEGPHRGGTRVESLAALLLSVFQITVSAKLCSKSQFLLSFLWNRLLLL